MAKDRVTVLVCTYLTETEKSPLLAIGNYKKPRCFCGLSCLPTEYEGSPNAWMNATIFEALLQKWDRKLARSGRKIALFIDNCYSSPSSSKSGVH